MRGRLVRREELTAGERRRMEELLADHFEGVTHASFARDLDEKSWVVLLEEEEDEWIAGFTTLLYYETRVSGEPMDVVYSGDTIVERGARGSAALPQAWIAAVRALHEGNVDGGSARAERRLYWLLLTSGFRTYRFLPVFWREFEPRPDVHPEDPAEPRSDPGAKALLDALARERLGRAYVPELGVARLDAPQVLKPELREVPVGKLADPYVACFLARNPGWQEGDELVCLTEIAAGNLTAAGRRMWERGRIVVPAVRPPAAMT